MTRIIDSLHRAGAEVLHGGSSPVHVSGHASQEELKILLNLVQPEWFVPVHGEYTHMVHHARLAESVGVAEDHVLVCEDGDALTLALSDDGTTRSTSNGARCPSGFLYVDGIVGDVGHGVLRDRRNLAEEGVGRRDRHRRRDHRRGRHRPRDRHPRLGVRPRGRGAARGGEGGGARVARRRRPTRAPPTSTRCGATARRSLGKFINERTKRRPAVIPVVMEV